MKRLLAFFLLTFSLVGFAQEEQEEELDDVFPIMSMPMLPGPRVILLDDLEPVSAKKRTAEIKTCRAAIVDGYKVLEVELDPQSFSTKKFEDFKISTEEFNALAADQQLAIYEQIMPLEIMIERAKMELDSEIQNNFFELISSPIGFKKMGEIRTAIEELDLCKMEEI